MPLLGTFIVPHPPLIIPQVGRGQEKEIQNTMDAYDEIGRRISELTPDTIIVITPHSVMYSDYLHISPGAGANGNLGEFGAPEVKMEVSYDQEFIRDLTALAEKEGIDAGTLGEKKKSLDHGTMVPLYYVNKFYQDYELVRISISGLSPLLHYRFGKCIGKVSQESKKKFVIIASGDMSHKLKKEGPYGYSEAGVSFDQQITEAIKQGDFLSFMTFSESFCEDAAECGLRSFIIMAGALDGKTVKSELLSYEGPFGVGYGVGAFTSTGEDEHRHFDSAYEQEEIERLKALKSEEDSYVRLARQSLEAYVKGKKYLNKPIDLKSELSDNKSGVFVSLKMNGRLRGCIGTTQPRTASIADEIIQNAVSAGTKDPRFPPVEEQELPWLVYSVDVLGKAEPIVSFNELDAIRYGIIVSSGDKHGLLLPNLEGVNTPDRQISIALQKAGISPDEPFHVERFEVVRHV